MTVTGQAAYSVWSPQFGPGTSTAVPRKFVPPGAIPVPPDGHAESTVATVVSSLEKAHSHSHPDSCVPSHMFAWTDKLLPLEGV